MKPIPCALLALTLLFPSCQSSTGKTASESQVAPASHDNGLPKFNTVREAVAFVVEERNIAVYNGNVYGFEYFKIGLPSGAMTNNWLLACYFREIFKSFGSAAYKDLASLLGHPDNFVQWGAYFVLQPYMNPHGLKRHTEDSPQNRQETLASLQSLLAQDS
ncbi:MAG: hypothetical protein ACI9X4_002602 [Glaciecola sp.]|jgi:hypothetical protein